MRLVALLLLCGLGGAALAQPGAQPLPTPDSAQPPPEALPPSPPPPPSEQPPTPPAPSVAVEVRLDAGWQLYHEAFAALLAGKRPRAAELVAQLQREHPGHPAALLIAHSSLVARATVTRATAAPREQPSSGARAELALFQTLHGVALGVELCGLAECDSGQAFIGLALLGGAAGAGLSLAQANLTSGQRALINSGTIWGAANAGLLMLAAQPSDYKVVIVTVMAGQLGGLGIGASLQAWHPTSGQVGLANSGGQWALALSGLTLAAAQPDLSDGEVAMILLVAMDAGLGVGAYLADRYPRISRGRGWVLDASGIVGAVGGAGLGVLVSGSADERATPALAAAGAVIGLGVGTYLTRNWDSDDDEAGVHAIVLPADRGRGATAGISFTW